MGFLCSDESEREKHGMRERERGWGELIERQKDRQIETVSQTDKSDKETETDRKKRAGVGTSGWNECKRVNPSQSQREQSGTIML